MRKYPKDFFFVALSSGEKLVNIIENRLIKVNKFNTVTKLI